MNFMITKFSLLIFGYQFTSVLPSDSTCNSFRMGVHILEINVFKFNFLNIYVNDYTVYFVENCIHTVNQKTGHWTFVRNFAKC